MIFLTGYPFSWTLYGSLCGCMRLEVIKALTSGHRNLTLAVYPCQPEWLVQDRQTHLICSNFPIQNQLVFSRGFFNINGGGGTAAIRS